MNEEYDRCLRCHRKLKNPEARKRGFGDVCWNKIKKVTGGDKRLFTVQLHIYKNKI